MSSASISAMGPMTTTAATTRPSARSRRRPAARSACWSICRARSFGSAAFQGGGVDLVAGQRFRLDLSPAPGDATRAPLPHPEVLAALEPGAELLLDDGRFRLTVLTAAADHAETIVVTGGHLTDRKGLNLPDVVLGLSPLTEKDRADLQFGLDLGADWIALSFVQRPEDVAEARRLIGKRAAIMVKIEKPQALVHLDELIQLVRCGDGGARRSRRGDAAGGRAQRPEADRRRLPPRRQAGGGGDPDAGFHGACAGPDPGRGLGRGDRRL